MWRDKFFAFLKLDKVWLNKLNDYFLGENQSVGRCPSKEAGLNVEIGHFFFFHWFKKWLKQIWRRFQDKRNWVLNNLLNEFWVHVSLDKDLYLLKHESPYFLMLTLLHIKLS